MICSVICCYGDEPHSRQASNLRVRLQPYCEQALLYLDQQRAELSVFCCAAAAAATTTIQSIRIISLSRADRFLQKLATGLAEHCGSRRYKALSLSGDQALAFAPTHCFLQSLRVTSERDDISTHAVIRSAAFQAGSARPKDFSIHPITTLGPRFQQLQDLEKLIRRINAVFAVMTTIRPLTARATQGFVAESEGEVTVEEGECVVVRHESMRGWCELVKASGMRGRVPSGDLKRFGDLTGMDFYVVHKCMNYHCQSPFVY